MPVQAEAIKAYCKSELGYSSRTVERGLKIGIRDDVLHKLQGGYYQIVRREGSQQSSAISSLIEGIGGMAESPPFL